MSLKDVDPFSTEAFLFGPGSAELTQGTIDAFKPPKVPEEDPAVTRLRDRQITDLAKLDEEENRRIKDLLVKSRGQRAFRTARQGRPAQTGRPGNDGRGRPSLPRAFNVRQSAPGSR